MFRRIRDFIYDVNDIFIALIIVLAAAGVIVWRSVDIMNYPKYLANRPVNTVTEDVDLTDQDLDPEDPNASADPDGQQGSSQEQQGGSQEQNQGTVPGGDSQSGEAQQGETNNAETDKSGTDKEDKDQTEKKVITATINIESGFRGGWNSVVNRLVSAGLLKSSDKDAFIKKVISLKLDRSLRVGTYKLSSDMSFEEMIKILCKAK